MNQILTELSYRTFDSLLEDVRGDLKTAALSGKIEPQQLIKVAQRVSYDLGLRINQTKQAVIQAENGKARLPDDFYVMNFALLCGEFTVKEALPQGTTVWQIGPDYKDWVDPPGCNETDSCRPTQWPLSNKPLCLTKCDTGFQLIQTINTQTRTYKYMLPIRFTSPRLVDCDCPNLKWRCPDEAYIWDNFIFVNFDCGNIYINYEGALVDDNGNLLVPDKPIINDYYEYALKDRILENMMFDGDLTITNQLQLVSAKLRTARAQAKSIVNTPDFLEMKKVWELNRRAMYQRYYAPLASYQWDYTLRSYGR